MSLTKDVKDEVKALPLNKKNLRKFGLTVGGIFIIISLLLFLNDNTGITFWILIIAGGMLFLSGLLVPEYLARTYIIWMTGAIILGWFVSRIILIVLFFFVITPIGLIAKVSGKRFLDLKFKNKSNSYWIIGAKKEKIDYTKMY